MDKEAKKGAKRHPFKLLLFVADEKIKHAKLECYNSIAKKLQFQLHVWCYFFPLAQTTCKFFVMIQIECPPAQKYLQSANSFTKVAQSSFCGHYKKTKNGLGLCKD